VNDMNTFERPWIVGLTGGIGSGKSTVADGFAALGAFVVDADALSHRLTAPNGAALDAISVAFDGVVTNGVLDRAALRERVFADTESRERLEAILHPMIRTATNHALASEAAFAATYVILMVPLLFESGTYKTRIDCAVVVDVDEAMQVERVARTRGLAADEVKRIISTQMPREERLNHAQFVIDNRGTADALTAQIAALHSVFVVNARTRVRSLIAAMAEAA
jgi:dephospho-CoA kinase